MKSVRLLVPARDEMRDAADYYERCSEGLGCDFTHCLDQAVHTIRENPERWPVVKSGVVHRYLLGRFPFCLLYRIDANEIVVLAIMHMSRNPECWLNRI
jgi:toxin ParE1/3/4